MPWIRAARGHGARSRAHHRSKCVNHRPGYGRLHLPPPRGRPHRPPHLAAPWNVTYCHHFRLRGLLSYKRERRRENLKKERRKGQDELELKQKLNRKRTWDRIWGNERNCDGEEDFELEQQRERERCREKCLKRWKKLQWWRRAWACAYEGAMAWGADPQT